MKFWESRYQEKDFVRFTIVDQKQMRIAGMVEICPSYKYSAYGTKIRILRIDLLLEYENETMFNELLTVILKHIYEDFGVLHSAEPSGLRCVSERTLCGA